MKMRPTYVQIMNALIPPDSHRNMTEHDPPLQSLTGTWTQMFDVEMNRANIMYVMCMSTD